MNPETRTAPVPQAVSNGDRQSMRDRIKSRARPKGEEIEVKGWGVTVEVRSMSVVQKGNLVGEDEPDATKLTTLLPEVIIFTCYDPETGEPVFTADDIDWLKDEPAATIEQVAAAGLRVSGMDEETEKEKKDD